MGSLRWHMLSRRAWDQLCLVLRASIVGCIVCRYAHHLASPSGTAKEASLWALHRCSANANSMMKTDGYFRLELEDQRIQCSESVIGPGT
ncbi:hypothetical protein FB451DRAFT_1236189 [Mycena latifolia]|nr:hypothetical protein FB451DRAFT_1236189 [Mycena latifolia]